LRGDSKLRIATDSGVLDAVIEAEEISVKLGMPQMLENNLVLEGIEGALIGVGNWHFVSYQKELKDQEFEFGPLLEQHSHFPDGVNVEFARVVSRNQIDMTIWERGAGATQACGTGAVATVFCGIQKGFLDSEVRVNMPGGTVSIRALENGEFILAGAVEHTFNGVYTWKI
ncbi:MAG: diaminopimelate epimerase, partial [Candidatus Cloacimonetes bacterium]|nr:diaminopimelate epimerase [Candidatus Cloacimonadota bacterium]